MKLLNAIMFYVCIITCVYFWWLSVDANSLNYAYTSVILFLCSIIFALTYILEDAKEENKLLKNHLNSYTSLLHEDK